MFSQLTAMMKKPALYEKGTAELWTDEHISKGMLESHLNPDWDSATRKHSFVQESVKWINSVAPVEKHPKLLDLGCGAGIYAEFFQKSGYHVTGMDFSMRSVNYAQNSAHEKNLPISYHLCDYLTLDFKEQFNLVTLINYDFGVLSTENREKLLGKIYKALIPGGLFIFDIFTPQLFIDKKEYRKWYYKDTSDFLCADPHICLDSFFLYEEQNTSCLCSIIITEHETKSINIWEHTFTKDEISNDLQNAGFKTKTFYGNIAGVDYSENSKEMCIVAQKGGKTNDSI